MGRSGRATAGAAAELDVIGARQILTAKPLGRQRLTAQLGRHRRFARSAALARGQHRKRVLQLPPDLLP